ncbi:MAG: CsbD family protein [Acidobacteriota bacterium]|nr:CsbD family protein [Acidobacteriota bacterium]
MKNRDEVEGSAENMKGRIKEAAGTLTGNPDLESEGANERAGGALKEGLGRARRKIGEEIEEIGEDLKR